MRHSLEVRVYIRHQVPDHEVFPVTRDRRVDIPGTAKRSAHIYRDQNKLIDSSTRDRSIHNPLEILLLKVRVKRLKRVGQIVDDGIALWRLIVTGWQIDRYLPRWVGAYLRSG